jgi:3-isopropylmalate/(R)-2-methylmalate dehydratase small subunit
VSSPDGAEFPFTLAEDRRMSLLEGLDETSLILRHRDDIDAFQARMRADRPWVFPVKSVPGGG